MDHSTLNHYIEQYYDSWLKYTKYLCKCYLPKNEPYDIFMDVMLALLEKKDVDLLPLIDCERDGNRRLLYYTKVMIKYTVFHYMKSCSPPVAYSIDSGSIFLNNAKLADKADPIALVEQPISDTDNEIREIESRLRDDSFITPFPTERTDDNYKNIDISVRHFIPMNVRNKSGSVRCIVNYTAEVTQKVGRQVTSKKKRYFSDKGSAMQWALQYRQNVILNRV